MRYDPHRVIDTLRLFIDLVDVLGLEDEIWTSGSEILRIISKYHRRDTGEGTIGDVFLWTLDILGPDFWESLNEGTLNSLMVWSLESKERTQRLLKLGNNVFNARDTADGYSLLHYKFIDGDPIPLLTMGASPNLVGFDPEHSPHRETPISLSMYRANTFVTLQWALRVTKVNLGTTFDQALEQYPLQHFHWTKEALVELVSEDLELSPVIYPQLPVCPYCSYQRLIMVQPYWMLILESITSRNRSQRILDIVGTMLSTSSQAVEVNRDDDDEADPDEEDMCLFCWQKWRETGLKPSLDGSECLGCNQSLSSPECMGKDRYDELYCQYCAAKQQYAEFAMKQQQRRQATLKVDSEDEEDHYSPYLIHT